MKKPLVPLLAFALAGTLTAGCATTVAVTARFPARNTSAAELRKIAVSNFSGSEGESFASGLEAELTSAQFDGTPYFTVVDSRQHDGRADAQAAAAYGRRVGAQGVLFGQVQQPIVHDESFQGVAFSCVATNQDGGCVKSALVQVACTKHTISMEAIPSLVKVSSGQVVYSSRKRGTANTSWCEGQSPSESDRALIASAQGQILQEVRLDIAPYNAILRATIKESNDGLPEQAATQFSGAVASAKKGDMSEACRMWTEVDKVSPNHAWTVYDLGVCAETNGDYPRALSLYERARTLSPRADNDVAESISRAQRLIGAKAGLAQAEQKTKDQAAQLRRQAADQERQRQAQAKATKAAQDAKHQRLVVMFGAPIAALIEAGQVRLGMTAAAVRAARGTPSSISKVPPDSELWRYGADAIAFFKGKVSHVGH